MLSYPETVHEFAQNRTGDQQSANSSAAHPQELAPEMTPGTKVPVTVVICSRNRGHVIGRCLDSVKAAQPAEIIVVDGDSSDDTVAIARAHGVPVLSDNGTGLGAARQLGASVAQNEYVVFVDTDVVVEPETFAQLLEEATTAGYDAVEAELRTFSSTPTYWQEAESWRRQVEFVKGVALVLGCQITLVRKSLLLQVGFDPAFKGAAEDADFCFRARAVGAVVAFSYKAVAYHEDRLSLVDLILQKIWHGRGLARMVTRYGSHYLARAASQVDASMGATKLNLRYVPFMALSWTFTAVGLGLESVKVACDPALRKALKSVDIA